MAESPQVTINIRLSPALLEQLDHLAEVLQADPELSARQSDPYRLNPGVHREMPAEPGEEGEGAGTTRTEAEVQDMNENIVPDHTSAP